MIYVIKEKRSAISILKYFENNSCLFIPPLKTRVIIKEYVVKLFNNAVQFWAIEMQKNEIAGFMACYFNDFDNKTGFITTVSVRKKYQGFGVGKQLLSEAIDYALEHKFIRIILEVHKDNDRALLLYKKIGFRIIENRVNSIMMEKNLENY